VSEEARYKEQVADLYTRTAAAYGQVGPPFFQHVGRRLVELAAVPSGTRVLDVATGRGAVLFAAAEREDGLSERFEPIFWLASKG